MEIVLDSKLIDEQGHDYLKKELNFPDYYGKNLDALYDCLTEIGVETKIIIDLNCQLDEDLIDTFEDASDANEMIEFKIRR